MGEACRLSPDERRPLVALDDEHVRIGVDDGAFVVEPGYGTTPPPR